MCSGVGSIIKTAGDCGISVIPSRNITLRIRSRRLLNPEAADQAAQNPRLPGQLHGHLCALLRRGGVVLGLQWADVDLENLTLSIRRAVTHPDRNQPEIKETKTKISIRTIGLSSLALPYLTPGEPGEFVVGGDITPKKFRPTILTNLYDRTHDIKLSQAAVGHATADMTLKHYVKGRESVVQSTAVIEDLYRARSGRNCRKIAGAESGKALAQDAFRAAEVSKNCRFNCRMAQITALQTNVKSKIEESILFYGTTKKSAKNQATATENFDAGHKQANLRLEDQASRLSRYCFTVA